MNAPAKLGKYEVQGVLGKGAMGVVYKALDPHIDRLVAIKTVRKDLLDSDLADQFLGRFRNEARAAGRLHHPNIIGIYEYGEDDNVAFIAMEYVDGTGLRDYLNRRAAFDFGQLVAIMSQLLQALDFAHGRGVVHRDVKPANLILTGDGTLKIADFGIARIDASNMTMTGLVMGTPSYMSPEQCQGLPSDHRSDLFSAGVVFYELLTGRKPFAGSVESIAYQICHRDAVPPSTLATLPLPPGMDALIATALAKDPDLRFQNARAFHAALRAAAGEVHATVAPADATVVNLAEVPLRTIAPVAWDDTVLTTVERQLARFVGPLAKIMVRQAAPRAHDMQELYALLAEGIADPARRESFVARPEVQEASGAHRTSQTSAAVSTRTGTRSNDVHSTGTSGSRAAPRLLEPAFVDHTTACLAVYLGPIAKVVARKAASQSTHVTEFVERCAANLGTQDRRAFLRDVGHAES